MLATTDPSSASSAAGLLQTIIFVVISLAAIYGLRALAAGQRPRLRALFYNGMTPLIPFVGLLFIIGLQLVPLLAGAFIIGQVFGRGLAVTPAESFLWLMLLGLLGTLSLHWLAASLPAAYAVTLPGLGPLTALKKSRPMVSGRRLAITGRALALAMLVALFLTAAVLPAVLWLPVLAPVMMGLLLPLAVLFAHAYLFNLYSQLL